MSNWMVGLVEGAIEPATSLLTPLLSPPPARLREQLHGMWSGTLSIANALYVVLVMAGGVLVASYGSLQTRYAIKEIAPRVVLGFLAANLSWPLISLGVDLAAGLTAAVSVAGLNPGEVMGGLLRNSVSGGPVFLAVLGLVATVMILVLLATMIVVAVLLVVLIVAAPLALSCHALPALEAIARAWWRATVGCVAVPTVQALLIAVTGRVLLSGPVPGQRITAGMVSPPGLMSLLVILALLYLMINVPGWVLRPALSVTGRRGRRSRIMSLLKTVVAFRTLGALGVLPATAGGFTAAANPTRALARRLLLGGVGNRGSASGRAAPVHGSGSGGPGGAGPAGSRGSGAGPAADPYRRVRADASGQYLLPITVTRVRRAHRSGPPPPTPAPPPSGRPTVGSGSGPGASSIGSGRAVRARQLSFPRDGMWPEQRPVLGRDGQYRLPITLTPQPQRARPLPPVTAPVTGARVPVSGQPASSPGRAGRQLRLPADALARPPQPPTCPGTGSTGDSR